MKEGTKYFSVVQECRAVVKYASSFTYQPVIFIAVELPW
jgi:hypothetical protein